MSELSNIFQRGKFENLMYYFINELADSGNTKENYDNAINLLEE